MKIKSTPLIDLYVINEPTFKDERGVFVKFFNSDVFLQHGLNCNFKERFYSVSNRNVIRGMHFQVSPFDQEKLVRVTHGKILDVVLDIRNESKTYGKYYSIVLSSNNYKALYIPKGFAHGFCTLSSKAVVEYMVTSTYSKISDSGIRWDSFDFDWPIDFPIVSNRDLNFTKFSKLSLEK